MRCWLSGHPSRSTLVVLAAAAAWTLFLGSLAVARHDDLRTNAFDLGYVSNTLWHTAHGAPFRMTTLEGATFAPEGVDPGRIRRPHSLLAFHVEPLLLLIAPLYRLWPDPRLLLWLQAAVVAAGALPVAWLARTVVGGRLAAPCFGLAYLLAPGLEGAALSDFHAVALAAAWLAIGLWLVESARPGAALPFFALAALSREDAALLVAFVGAVLAARGWLTGRAVGPPAGVAAAAGLWAAACFLAVMPYFNGGGSLFAARYAWLLGDPTAFAWDDAIAYLALQLLTGGLVCLLAPLELVAAAPLVLLNALSGFDWMRSGGAHYSAAVVPVLLWAGARGAGRLGRPTVAGVLVLAAALAAHLWVGASPLRPGFAWPEADPRAAGVRAALSVVPADASVSATSGLYPHLSGRARAQWFPAGADADWIALDLLGTSHPLTAAELRGAAAELLARPDRELVAARDGLLLLRRGSGPVGEPPEALLGPLRPGRAPGPGLARFGEALELVGWRLRRWPEVGLFGDAGTLETDWVAPARVDEELAFALIATRRSDGAVVAVQTDSAPEALWHPTTRWRPGETVRLRMPVARLARVQALGLAVLDGRGVRRPVRVLAGGAGLTAWEGGSALRLTGT
ncbi:MAG TPA: DUF2079 domain-containing protein [Chloroflexota bacterium]|nr:DUF2079 domain-containing protein [Chloroflexota bacterium]